MFKYYAKWDGLEGERDELGHTANVDGYPRPKLLVVFICIEDGQYTRRRRAYFVHLT